MITGNHSSQLPERNVSISSVNIDHYSLSAVKASSSSANDDSVLCYDECSEFKSLLSCYKVIFYYIYPRIKQFTNCTVPAMYCHQLFAQCSSSRIIISLANNNVSK